MSEESMTGRSPGAEQAAEEAQKTIVDVRKYSGGNALLDAEIEAGKRMAGEPGIDEPIASNFSQGEKDTSDPEDAENFTTTGAYPADQTRLDKNYSTPKISPHGEANT